MMMNEIESTRTAEEILEMIGKRVRYLESILGKPNELTPQHQNEFEKNLTTLFA